MNSPDSPSDSPTDPDSKNDSPAPESPIVLAADVLPDELTLIPGSQKPVFPGMMFPVIFAPGPIADLLRKKAAEDQDKNVGFILAREEIQDDDLEVIRTKLNSVGTVARMTSFQEATDGSVRAIFQGLRRFEILQVSRRKALIVAQVIYLREPPIEANSDRIRALSMAILNTMRELIKNNPMFSEEIKLFLNRSTWDDPGRLADFSASVTSATGEELQSILDMLDVETRLERVLILLRKELDLNQLKEKIQHQIEEKISRQQREFFLREQLRAIKEELGLEKDDKSTEIELIEARIAKLELTEEAKKRVDEELKKLRLLPPESPEFNVARNYLEWITSLPWGQTTQDHLDLARAKEILDRDHHGLEDVKARILEFIGVSKLRGKVGGSILCLSGPPGVGKTSLGRAIADALGRKFFRFSLGGMRDEAEIKGHRRTYIGAMPGKFIQTMRTTGSQNPVIMLDEIDKIGMSYQGDPASALLEVLDPEQNNSFLDNYLDVRFDLSKVLFIATANVLETIPAPLLDRMEIIRLSGYIMPEKLAIAKQHLIPRLRPEHGLDGNDIRFMDSGIRALIDGYAREAGVRALEKAVKGCMRKVAARKAMGTLTGVVTVNAAMVEELLGRPDFPEDTMLKQHAPGVVTGLAWTALGGSVLFIEAMSIPGKPSLKLTGQLGDVMQESASIAISVVQANGAQLGIEAHFFEEHLVHLHVPAGATKKDGPSAGVTMATALVSMATNTKLPEHLAMTGELTLTGNVLPVGGIREKVIAARRSGVRDVILPDANRKDFEEIPEVVRDGITPHFCSRYEEVAQLVFHGGLDTDRKGRPTPKKSR